MSGWREMLMDVIKLTDTVAGLNHDVEKLDTILRDVDKRLVRVESALEFSGNLNSMRIIESPSKEK